MLFLDPLIPGHFRGLIFRVFHLPKPTLLPIPSDVKRERRTRRCRNSEMSFPCSSRASPSRLFTSRARFIRRLTPVYVYGRAAHGRRRRGRRCNRRASECFFFFSFLLLEDPSLVLVEEEFRSRGRRRKRKSSNENEREREREKGKRERKGEEGRKRERERKRQKQGEGKEGPGVPRAGLLAS